MSPDPSTPMRCRLLLEQWRQQLVLSGRERSVVEGLLNAFDRQLQRLQHQHLKVAVFGRVGVGKSSLLNALLGHAAFATDVAHGCTRHQQAQRWDQAIEGLQRVELVDTPGIDEIAAAGRARLASRVALGADLVLLVLDGDLTSVELEALQALLASGKPLLLVLNRSDCWPAEEQAALVASVRRRLPSEARHVELVAVAAAPRRASLLADGRVRSSVEPPRIGPLREVLVPLLQQHGELLLALNALRSADRLHHTLQRWRLSHSRQAAQTMIGRFAALKATGVAANPLVLLDLAGGLACDTALVLQLCQLYGLKMQSSSARALLTRLSGHNALLGGAQLGIQVVLSLIRQVLLVAAPLTGGLSLAPAAPVAIAQAALAVHTTRRTGRLAAVELIKGAERGGKPGALMRRLSQSDPQVRQWLNTWQSHPPTSRGPSLQALLP